MKEGENINGVCLCMIRMRSSVRGIKFIGN